MARSAESIDGRQADAVCTTMIIGLTGRYCAGKDRGAGVFAVARVPRHRRRRAWPRGAGERSRAGHRASSARAVRRAGRRGGQARPGQDRLRRSRRPAAPGGHPASRHHGTDQGASLHGGGDVVINAPLLHRAGFRLLCDAVVFVTRPCRSCACCGPCGGTASPCAMRGHGSAPRTTCALNLMIPAVDTYSVRNLGSVRSLERRVARLARRLRG